jgi:hypothetical protein
MACLDAQWRLEQAEFSAEMMVYTVEETAQKLSGAVH